MSASNQNYKELAIPYFREVFELIDDVLKRRGIPYYLIGSVFLSKGSIQQTFNKSEFGDIDQFVRSNVTQDSESILRDIFRRK